jgi:pimeloyl-ACP methyl ester carboxylesterase
VVEALGLLSMVVFVAFFSAYLFLQFFSLGYERRHLTLVGLLLGQSIAGFAATVLLLAGEANQARVLAVPLLSWSVVTLVLASIKLFVFDHLRLHSPEHVTKERIKVGLPHDRFSVVTQDDVKIVGFHIRSGHSKAIILCHGGANCKNSFENVGLAQWLSFDYDVISFDTRGHFESHGDWTGDGKTKLDLVAVLGYVQTFGYERVGVIGRSLGGWTAMLVAAEGNGIDSLILISSPFGKVRDVRIVSQLEPLRILPGRLLVRALQGLRYRNYDDSTTPTPRDVAERIQVPTFLVYSRLDNTLGVTEEDVQDVYERIRVHKRLKIFPETGHLPYAWHLGKLYQMSLDWFADTLRD